MNLLDLIPGGRIWQIAVIAALAASLIGGVTYAVHSYSASLRAEGYEKRKTEDEAAMLAQQTQNRELQRAAEIRYTVTAGVRDRFITNTVTEVRNATVSLAACPVGASAVRLLNGTAHCASSDSAAACGPN